VGVDQNSQDRPPPGLSRAVYPQAAAFGEKGYVLTNLERLVTWARSGSL